ncbi:MAG: hypothetical protein ABEK84_07745, partial [Salinibacter sp.]
MGSTKQTGILQSPSSSVQPLPPAVRFTACLVLFGLLGPLFWPAPVRGQSSITGGEVPCRNGAAARYSCQNVDLMSYLSIDALGGTSETNLNDIWGWTDPKTGTEYAIVGRTDGTAFVDVSTPTDPVYVGQLP